MRHNPPLYSLNGRDDQAVLILSRSSDFRMGGLLSVKNLTGHHAYIELTEAQLELLSYELHQMFERINYEEGALT